MKKNYEVHLNTLAIEVTKRCNMTCKHCLRGEAEEVDNDETLIPNIFKGIASIETIVFSGGEPTLNVSFIEKCVDYVLDNEIQVNGCFIATNGLIYSERLVQCVRRLYERWLDSYYGKQSYVCMWEHDGNYKKRVCEFQAGEDGHILSYFDDEECDYRFDIAVSMDNWHDAIPITTWLKWKKCGFYSHAKEVPPSKDNSFRQVLCMGRAEDLPIGRTFTPFEPSADYDEELDRSGVCWESVLYVSCEGKVYLGCDLSYDAMQEDDNLLGEIKEDTLVMQIQEFVSQRRD